MFGFHVTIPGFSNCFQFRAEALILIAISPIAYHEGVSAFVLLVSYLSAVTLVKVFVKQSIDLGYPFPNTITAMHMLAVCIVTLIFERPSMDEALKVLPISVLNGLSLLTNNSAFLYGGVAFVSMIAANVPFMTFSLELLKGKRSLNFASAFSVGLVCAGSVCCVQGEVNVSLAAFVLATVSALLRAARGVWQHELVSVSLSPLRLVFWNGFWSGCITLVILGPNRNGILNGPAMSSICTNAQIGLLSSIVAAVCLNITQWYAMKAVGALMASIIGNLNLILVIALSIAWLHEQVTPWQFLGVLLLATGTFANKMLPACRRARRIQDRIKEPGVTRRGPRTPNLHG
ncbi:Probable sugar phosphate/phosphate translocator At4g32390 [Durusdinium trenchii]|uniref:Probable sugar phosphate/phosphate translocator At4g32390 n=1 Tax=Durusdinium trenchii TaxID=1381693 RepID=A0ABP0H5Q8_9DINO